MMVITKSCLSQSHLFKTIAQCHREQGDEYAERRNLGPLPYN
jgi:hypothetical protein